MKIFKWRRDKPGQGAVEFALVLPVLLLLIYGLIEFGRLIFVYTAVNSAGREAARYGVAVGDGTGGIPRYIDCDGIRAAALNVGGFAGMENADVTIYYDRGPGGDVTGLPSPPTCYWVKHRVIDHNEEGLIGYGDRIKITVSVTYSPLLTYMSLDVPDFTMSANAFRTIVKDARVAPDYGAGGTFPTFTFTPGPSPTPTHTATFTLTPSITPTLENTPTASLTPSPMPPTATQTPGVPPAPPLNPQVTWTQNGNKCEDIVWTWSSNGSWSSNPGSWPISYQVWIDGVSWGTIPALDPNPTSWDTGIDLNNHGSVEYGVQAIFSGMVGGEPAVLNVAYECDLGILIVTLP